MATEELRLEASVVDKFSAPLNRLRNALGAVKPPQALISSTKDFEKFHAAVAQSTDAIRNGLTNALSGIGVQSAITAGAIAGLTAAVSRFAGNTSEMKALARETGLTVQSFRLLKSIAEQFQVSPDTVTGGLRQFGSNVFDARRSMGQAFTEISKIDYDLAQQLKNSKTTDEALDKALDNFASDPNRQRVARKSELLFGTRDFERLTGQGRAALNQALTDAQQRLGPLTAEAEKRAQAFETAVGKLKQSLTGLETTVGTQFAPHLTEAIEGFDRFIQRHPGITTLATSIVALGVALKAMDLIGLTRLFGLLGLVPKGALAIGATAAPLIAGGAAAGAGLALAMGPKERAAAAERRRQVVREMGVLDSVIDNKVTRGDEKGATETRAKKQKLEEEFKELNRTIDGSDAASPALKSGAAIGEATKGRFNGDDAAVAPDAQPARPGPPPASDASQEGMAGKYRPIYSLKPEDTGDSVVNTIAGEASYRRPGAVDAVINNMMNRLGSRGWGPSGSLHQVARAPGQYEGYRSAGVAEAAFIRERIKAIASGAVPDNTDGSNAYRASWYNGPWMRRHGINGRNVGGNVFAYEPGVANGPFAPYREPRATGAFNAAREAGNFGANQQAGPTGRAELEVTINGLPHGWKSRADGGDLFRDVKVGRGRSMMMAPDEP